jgi:hypothetical protein
MSSLTSLKLWHELPLGEKLSTYKQTNLRISKLFMLNQLSSMKFGLRAYCESELNQFSKRLHDSSCDHDPRILCVASRTQQEAFELMNFAQQTTLANDLYLLHWKGWSELIQSLPNIHTKARIVIEIRNEGVRKRVLQGMDPKERNELLLRIRTEHRSGYHHSLDEEQWYRVATTDSHPVCDICREGYELGESIPLKTCGGHTTHLDCAEDAWGKYRINWLARPCQLCDGTEMSAKEYDAKIDNELDAFMFGERDRT